MAGTISEFAIFHMVRGTFAKFALLAFFVTAAFLSNSMAQSVNYVATTTGQVTGNSLTFAHNSGTDANRLVMLAVELGRQSSISGTPTYAGTAMTLVGTSNISSGSGVRCTVAIYRILNPPTGSQNIVINATHGGDSTDGIIAGAVTFSNVNPTTPLRAYVGTSGDSATSSVTVQTGPGEIVFGGISHASNTTVANNSGQIQRWQLKRATATDAAKGVGSTKAIASGATTTFGFTNHNERWAMGAVSVRPVACTVSAASSSPTTCLGNAITTVTHNTSGATGIGTPLGLPPGVTAAYASNVITISGTPTIPGTFNYSIPLTGGCSGFSATGTITVNARPVIGGGTSAAGTGSVNFEIYSSAPAGDTVDNIPTTGASSTGTRADFTVATVSTPVSYRLTGFINIPTAGSYTFFTNSDDGSKLFINGGLVVNNDGSHGPQEVSGIVSLTPGWYPITVVFFNNVGTGSLSASYQGPSIAKQSIPSSILSATLPASTLTLCAGATANLTPNTGGTWTSSAPSVASVSNAGVVTGLAAGSTTLTFTNLATGCTNTVSATIVAGPALGGAESVCVGQIANVTPGTGGSWVSSNNAIATVTNAGAVTGQSAGSVTLTFTNTATGCVSTRLFNVIARPTLGGASAVCVGSTASVTPATGGQWASSNNAIATITNTGVLTGQSGGVVTLTFTDGTTGCTNTRLMTVNALTSLGGANSTCVGIPALVTPNTGGNWSSSNNAIATVTNGGVVNAISGGTVTLSFFNSTTGCTSSKLFTVNVPIGSGGGEGIGGATAVCAGFQTNVTPNTGGVWATSDPAIATVTNAGAVTGFAPGVVTLTFTEDGSGCVSTVDFTVYPNVVAGGASSVCQGLTANVTPTTNGTWVSSDPAIAFVNNAGQVTGLQPGTVTLTFTSLGGCSDSRSFTVHPKPLALGAASVQVGQTANVIPATGGIWVSSNPAIATIDNDGLVTGIAEGAVTLTYTDSVTGCIGTKALAVIDPGFYKNESMTDSGDKTDPNPENNQDPEVVFPQSFTSLIITVFQDVDGDEDGDEPVPSVTITVRDGDGNVVAVVSTGLDGAFTIDDLPPGFYTVEQTVPNGNFTYTTNPFPVSVILNETVRADFINSQLGQISGTIFANDGDDVMANVVVALLDENGAPVLDGNGAPIVTSTNDAGFYIFDRISPGTYQVKQTVPSGFVAVDDVDGTDLTINGDVTPIVIGPGTVITNQNFINFEPGKIVGNVSIDTDLNLAGDQPHVGVTVTLFRPGFGADGIVGNTDDNLPVDTTTTDPEGNFSFTGLDPGNYTVVQTVPANFTAVSDSDGGIFTTVGDITPIAIVEGSTGLANFLNQPQTDIAVDKSVNNSTPVIGSNVTFTVVVTNNGPQNATDVKVDDVALGLLYVSHNASKGSFALSPGAPENTFSGLWTVGALNVGESATLTVVATVTPNAILTTYKNSVNAYSELGDPVPENNQDEVTLNPTFGSISGNVSRDTSGNNQGNVPVVGVTISLVDTNGNPVLGANNLPLTTFTDAAGNYSFTSLPPGSYRVVETVPSGNVAVNDVDGGNLAINGDITPITLTGGQTVTDQDFVIAALGSISGTITEDTSGNNEGNTPLGGVVVILLQSNGNPVLDGNGDPITTVTDGSGNYSFPGITPGLYQVAHVPPAGMIAVDDVDGTNLTVNGDVTPITVLPGANVTGMDFVDAALGSISGSVLADAVGDGSVLTGIPTVTITLVNTVTNLPVATTTTSTSGFYTFTNIPSGSYRVVETQPAGYSSVSDVDGGNLDINGDVTAILLLPGEAVIDQNFVEILNATITGIVQEDTNNDDVGDSPLGGVTVTLRDEDDNIVATTTTAPNGTYSFLDVVPGSYTVVQTDLPGFTSITSNTVPVTLLPGGSAFVPFVDEQLGSISGVVDADTDGDNDGDTVLPNVTVTLRDGSNNVIATTTTDDNGYYIFPNLPVGSYTVVQTDLPNYVSLTSNTVTVTLTPGESETVNFTDAQFASITGNVFNDTNRLTDGIVNGTGTNAGGIYINLVNPTGDLVIASIPVNADGTYSFTAANGVQINTSYILVLTTAQETVGNVLTTASLPVPWYRTGENLGAGAGSDGTPDSKLTVTTTVGALAQANFGIVQVCDLTPTITAVPNVMNGPTDFNIRVQVVELYNVNTEGTITVRVPKDNRWTLRVPYENGLTELDGFPMENAKWTFSQTATEYIFTSANPSIIIPGGGFSYFGLKARWNAGQTEGQFTLSTQITAGSGNEVRFSNNNDAEKLDYFIR